MDRNEFPLDPRHVAVPLLVPKKISEPMVRSAQTLYLFCTKINTISKQTETSIPLDPHLQRVPSGASKMISKPMVCSAQTVHLSCAETNTISKRTELSFHLTYITEEYHQVCSTWFPCPWYIRCKPCTYLAPIFKLSPNGSKWASACSTSRRSTIMCIQNDFLAYGTFGASRVPILRQD
jgi:hypothetical protein